MSTPIPRISIIGAGVVGSAIGRLAAKAGRQIVAVASRTESSARAAAEQIGQDVRVCSPTEAASLGDIVLLTVDDDAIVGVAKQLADARAVRSGATVAHCSGTLTSDALAPLGELGASLASMHPLQTFPSADAAEKSLPGCYCFCEGQPPAVEQVMQLARDLGCTAVRIDPARKVLYHAAACIASNYLATIEELALAAAHLAGIDRDAAVKAFGPLVVTTAQNVSRLGPAAALTGPIARGDAETVRRHLDALVAADAELAMLYRIMGERTLDLARSAGKLSPDVAGRVRDALDAKTHL